MMKEDERYEDWRRQRTGRVADETGFCDAVMTEVRSAASLRNQSGPIEKLAGALRRGESALGDSSWLMTGAGAAAGVARLFLVAALIFGTV